MSTGARLTKTGGVTPEVSALDPEPPTVSALKESRPPVHYHMPRFLPPLPPPRWKVWRPLTPPSSPDDDESRCSTPSSTTSTLSLASDVEPVGREHMPACKAVAEGGDGLPLMQVCAMVFSFFDKIVVLSVIVIVEHLYELWELSLYNIYNRMEVFTVAVAL